MKLKGVDMNSHKVRNKMKKLSYMENMHKSVHNGEMMPEGRKMKRITKMHNLFHKIEKMNNLDQMMTVMEDLQNVKHNYKNKWGKGKRRHGMMKKWKKWHGKGKGRWGKGKRRHGMMKKWKKWHGKGKGRWGKGHRGWKKGKGNRHHKKMKMMRMMKLV